jgi:hypothetical protein
LRYKSWSQLGFILCALAITVLAMFFLGTPATAQLDLAETKQPEAVVLKGRIVDLTCAVNGKIMTGTWNNVAADHKMADGNIQKACGTMCLKGGQPAALFSDNQITAVLACNPQGTEEAFYYLAKYLATPVEVEGHWAAGGADTKIFVPVRIRRGVLGLESRVGNRTGGWRVLDCGNMAG